MVHTLTSTEARIIGCLIEKSIVTPDQYPLTLNALTNACNQKSGRDPVMTLTQGEVQRSIRALEAKHLLRIEENFKSRAEKYTQRFCGTRYSDFQFDAAEIAVICLMLLRGPQTPGELRARSGRLHAFQDNTEVTSTLENLIHRDGKPLIVKLPRTAGRKDSEYMHLFCGAVDVSAMTPEVKTPDSTSTRRASGAKEQASVAELSARVSQLEFEVAELKKRLT